MKRLWIGAGILSVLLILGLFITEYMDGTHRAQAQELHRAAVLAAEGSLHDAELCTQRAREQWEAGHDTVAAFADHAPMDEIDARFAELRALARAGDESDYAAACAYLAVLIEAMGKAHTLSWWNLM